MHVASRLLLRAETSLIPSELPSLVSGMDLQLLESSTTAFRTCTNSRFTVGCKNSNQEFPGLVGSRDLLDLLLR